MGRDGEETDSRKLEWPKTVELGVAGCAIGDGERGEWLRGEGESVVVVGDVWLQPEFLFRRGPAGSAGSGLARELNHWVKDRMATRARCG
jgi:hypothetical protein